MRFAGFKKDKDRYHIAMNILKVQNVFADDIKFEINPVKLEQILEPSDFMRLQRVTLDSYIDMYFKAVSDEKSKLGWRNLLGVYESEFTINAEKLDSLLTESLAYFDPDTKYKYLRWHDIAVMVLVAKIFGHSHRGEGARHLLYNVSKFNTKVIDETEKLLEKRY